MLENNIENPFPPLPRLENNMITPSFSCDLHRSHARKQHNLKCELDYPYIYFPYISLACAYLGPRNGPSPISKNRLKVVKSPPYAPRLMGEANNKKHMIYLVNKYMGTWE